MIQMDPDRCIRGILDGNRRMIAKTITLIESCLKDHRKAAFSVMEKILPHTGKSIRLGVPGVGKSTFIENPGCFLADKGHKVEQEKMSPSAAAEVLLS